MPEDEVPTVQGRLVTNAEQAHRLLLPRAGEKRTAVHLAAARLLVAANTAPVLGGCIGPFSLAARLFGVSEALEATAADPDTIHLLLDKATQFLVDYVRAFRDAGAVGVVMAEPVAGLLSPRSLGRFSAPYVRRIVEAVQTPEFAIILHNCGARLIHLPKILESGAEIYHFGEPMEMGAALAQAAGEVVLGGNLDPSAVFLNGTPEVVHAETRQLLSITAGHRNFFLSTGCDLPPHVPLANLDAFFAAAQPAG
jgi:uroporphyrinogen decarboxylase